MNFITQPYRSMQCGQTCLAMITGKNVDEICEELGKHWSTSIDTDLMSYLNRSQYKTRLVKGSCITFEEIPNNSIIRLCYPSESGHFIVKTKGKYYDPSVGIIEEIKAHVKITHYLTFEEKLKNKKTTQ